MKHLIAFSLKRRFNNKAIIILNILMIILAGVGLFVDKVILEVNPKLFDPIVLYVDDDLYQKQVLFDIDTEKLIIKLDDQKENSDQLRMKFDNDQWIVSSVYPLTADQTSAIYHIIQNYCQNTLMETIDHQQLTIVNDALFPTMINDVSSSSEIDATKQNLMFMIITSIYFMMLSYSSVIANEVVYEKTSKILELILTSVSAKTHFISKMLIGWLTIMIQTLLTGGIIALWILIRNSYDGGFGLLAFGNRIGILPMKFLSFSKLLSYLKIDGQMISAFMIALIFLVLGILFLQMIMVIVSSFVTSIEESSNVQAPCYLVLLVIYYFTLFVNNPYQMSEGIGYVLSFVPFFSMLFMPCRLLIQNVSAYEIVIALFMAITAIIFILDFGLYFYKQGILDNKKMKRKLIKQK